MRNKATGETVEGYTILTTDPNELITRERIHDRMPVILSPADYDRWLHPGDPAHPPIDLLRPFPAEKMTCWQVGKDVGNVRNDRPDPEKIMLTSIPTRLLASTGAHPAKATPWLESAPYNLDACLSLLTRTADAPRIAPATLIAIRIRAHSAASALRQQLSIPILLPR